MKTEYLYLIKAALTLQHGLNLTLSHEGVFDKIAGTHTDFHPDVINNVCDTLIGAKQLIQDHIDGIHK